MYYTYVLISEKDGNFYIGFTKNIEKRLEEHLKGKVNATAHRNPLKLVYYEACLNKIDAIKREKYFKSGYGRRFLKNRLEAFLNSEF
jgi:putative endonuclease